ncbi:MAG TPA: histidine kinase [Sphingobacteriaceae bacterium]
MTRRKYRSAYLDMIGITLVIVLSLAVILPLLYLMMTQATLMKTLREGLSIIIVFSSLSLLIAAVILLFDKLSARIRHAAVRIICEAAVVAVVAFFVLDRLYIILEDSPSPSIYKTFIGMNALGTAFVYLFQKGLFLKQQAAEKVNETGVLQKDLNQYRLHALKNQVNPHFLFNSLSVLSSLVHKDANLAEQFVVRLSQAYTYILAQKEAGLVSLEEELRFAESYFFLLRIRFESKLQLEIDVPQGGEYSVPPLILQLLLENAVKHNRMSAARPLKITIRQEGMTLVITNNVHRRDAGEESTGLGLENIRKRYSMITSERVLVNAGVESFSVSLPILDNKSTLHEL